MSTESVSSERDVGGIRALGEDLQALWRRLPNRAVFVCGFVAWIALFHFLGNSTFGYVDTPSLFTWMYNAYNAPGVDDGHGNLIPFVVLGLLIWKRDELLKLTYRGWTPGVWVFALGLAFHVAGFMAQQQRISIVGLFVGLYGLAGYCWGPEWLKKTFFPYFLFIFCVPLGSLAQPVTFPLRVFVSVISVGIGNSLLDIDVTRSGTLISIVREGGMEGAVREAFSLDVAPACSGIRSLITLFALTTTFGFLSYQLWWKRGLLMLSSIPLALLGNVVRVTIVIVIGDAMGQEAALAVEQKLGFLTFLIAILGVFALDYLLREGPQSGPEGREV